MWKDACKGPVLKSSLGSSHGMSAHWTFFCAISKLSSALRKQCKMQQVPVPELLCLLSVSVHGFQRDNFFI